MIDNVIIKSLSKYNDERGWLSEIYRNDEIQYQPVMAYMSLTNPGVIRGPHEHKEQSDCFIFIGPGDFELHLWDKQENSSTKGEHFEITVGDNNPVVVIVPPGVVHGYKCISKIPAYSLNLPNKLYKGKNKKEEIDEIRWENDSNSPYKIK